MNTYLWTTKDGHELVIIQTGFETIVVYEGRRLSLPRRRYQLLPGEGGGWTAKSIREARLQDACAARTSTLSRDVAEALVALNIDVPVGVGRRAGLKAQRRSGKAHTTHADE